MCSLRTIFIHMNVTHANFHCKRIFRWECLLKLLVIVALHHIRPLPDTLKIMPKAIQTDEILSSWFFLPVSLFYSQLLALSIWLLRAFVCIVVVVVVYGWQCLVCDLLLFCQWLYGNRIHSYGFSGTYVVIITEHTHGWKTISQFDRTENNPLPHLVKKNAWNCRFFNLTSFLFAAFFHSLVCLSVTMCVRARVYVCTYKSKGERHQTEQKLHKSLCKSTHKFVHLKFSNTQNFPSVGFSLSGNFFVIIIIIIFVSSMCRMCFFFLHWRCIFMRES